MAKRWLVISHDASNSGAPRMLLEVLKGVRAVSGPGWECEIIFNHGGSLMDDFAKVGPVRRLSHPWTEGSGLVAGMLRRLSRLLPLKTARFSRWVAEWETRGGGIVYSNTGTNGRLLKALPAGIGPVVSHVHELAYAIQRFNSRSGLAATLLRTDYFWAVSAAVSADLQALGVAQNRIRRIPNFISAIPAMPDVDAARVEICRKLALPAETKLIIGCGHIQQSKGADLFVEVAKALAKKQTNPPVFVWLGRNGSWCGGGQTVKYRGGKHVRFIGEVADPGMYFAAGEVVLVTSRMESFSRVVLEAGALGRPVLAFAAARGPAELLDADSLIDDMQAEAMAEELLRLLSNPSEAARRGGQLRKRILAEFTAEKWIGMVLETVECMPCGKSNLGCQEPSRGQAKSADVERS